MGNPDRSAACPPQFVMTNDQFPSFPIPTEPDHPPTQLPILTLDSSPDSLLQKSTLAPQHNRPVIQRSLNCQHTIKMIHLVLNQLRHISFQLEHLRRPI